MKIIRPVRIAVEELTSSIPLDDAPLWEEGEYVENDEVIYDIWVYRALATTTDRPDIGAALVVPTWVQVGATSRWRMFDGRTATQSTALGEIEVEIVHPQNINAIALLNVDAASIQITVFDIVDGLVYDSGEIELFNDNIVSSWYDYFFEPYVVRNEYVSIDLPAYYPGATITITLRGGLETDVVGCGEVVLGTIRTLGVSNHGTGTGIIDYSRKETNEFGEFFILQRRYSKRVSYDISVESSLVGMVQKTLADLRTTPTVWIGSEDYDTTIVYGFYKDFDIVISTPSLSQCSISVEGL